MTAHAGTRTSSSAAITATRRDTPAGPSNLRASGAITHATVTSATEARTNQGIGREYKKTASKTATIAHGAHDSRPVSRARGLHETGDAGIGLPPGMRE